MTEYNAPLVIQDLPIPALEPGALLVRILSSTLCGTDISRWHGSLPLPKGHSLPIVTGHEPCGIVEEIGGTRTDILGKPVKRGDRITWSYVACGSCFYCSVAQQPCICPDRASWGNNRSDREPYLLGSCSEYMYVPPQCLLVKVPDVVSSASAAASACAYRTVMHGFDRLGAIKSHETVLIQGSGPLGIFSAAVAKDNGAKRVLMIGAPAARLGVGLKMGVDTALNFEEVQDPADRRQWVRDQTDGRGADVVIQAATNAAVAEGLALLRPGGRFVNIGMGGPGAIAVDQLPQQLTFYTVRSGEPRHWLQALDFMAARADRYPFDDMITAHYSLDGINDAMAAMASFQVVKAAIDFS
jgi:threonine dehydrogenase-like Zn-dependent dehydrogenase